MIRGLALLTAWVAVAVGGGCGLLPKDNPPVMKPEGSPRPDPIIWKREGYEPASSQDAVFTVLVQEREAFASGFKQLKPTTQPREYAEFLGNYLEGQKKIDLGACPEDFKQSFEEYLAAVEDLRAALAPLPSSYEKERFLAGIKSLYDGSVSKAEFLGGDVTSSMKEVTLQYSQTMESAKNHGIEVR